jgi:hypothetical protein
MKIETTRRNWAAAGSIYQHASAAAESLSRVNRTAPPPLRQTLPYAVRRTAGNSGKETADSHVVSGLNDDDSVANYAIVNELRRLGEQIELQHLVARIKVLSATFILNSIADLCSVP